MLERLRRGARHTLAILGALPSAPKRDLLRRMIAFSRALPGQFERPLPEMLARLTPAVETAPDGPAVASRTPDADEVRRLADAVAAWHVQSPLGLCLRRSLLRYHFLRQARLPVTIVFGARFKGEGEGGGLGGHAWLTLAGRPYYEDPADYAGFVEMYRFPAAGEQTADAGRGAE